MNILIDGRPLVANRTGIATFLLGSLTAWARQCPSDTFFVPLPKDMHPNFATVSMPRNIRIFVCSNFLLQRLPNLVWLCVKMPGLCRKFKIDLYFSPLPCIPFLLPRKLKTLIVVHDVVNIEFKRTMQWTNVLSNKLFFKRSVRLAHVLWTNSCYTKKKVEHYFPVRRCKDIFVGCAVNRSVFKPLNLLESEVKALRQQFHIESDFLLFVGSLEPRKNLSFLLSLMPELYQKHHLQLVVIGGHGWKSSSIGEQISADGFPKQSIVFCGFVTTKELAKLYNMAACFVSTSFNEGFGMPQLEALLCGCPVVTAHNSAMIEVAKGKDGAVTVEGWERKTWVDAIVRVTTQRPQVNPSQLTSYDWEQIVSRLSIRIGNYV